MRQARRRALAEDIELGELLHGRRPAAPPSRRSPGRAALLLPSSGTTGLPKLVELTHRALVANLVQMRIPFPAVEGGRLLGLAPFFHSMGLQCGLHRGLDGGAATVRLARFELEGMLHALQEHRVDQALVAPPLVAALAHHPIVGEYDLSSLTLVGSGGAPLNPSLERAAADRLGCVVGSGYGITEAGPLVSAPSFREPVTLRVGPAAGSPRHRGPGGRGRGAASRAPAGSTATATTRMRPPRRSTPTAGCTPVTSGPSTRTATSRSPAAPRS